MNLFQSKIYLSKVLYFYFTCIHPPQELATQSVTAHCLYFSSPFILPFLVQKSPILQSSSPWHFSRYLLFPNPNFSPDTCGIPLFPNPRHSTPVDSATHFLNLLSQGFSWRKYLGEQVSRQVWELYRHLTRSDMNCLMNVFALTSL